MDNQQILKHLDDIWTFGHEPTDEEREAVRAAMDIIEEYIKTGGWIPCSERLPEENQSVIACFAHGTVTELRFYDKKFHGIYDYDEKVIVAWQPLPEPYHG